MTVEEYLARGGQITVLPPGSAMNGHSPQLGKPVLAPASLIGMTYAEAIKCFFDSAKTICREEAFRASNRKGIAKAKLTRSEKSRVRRARLVKDYMAGASVDAIAKAEGVSVGRIQSILREEGAL